MNKVIPSGAALHKLSLSSKIYRPYTTISSATLTITSKASSQLTKITKPSQPYLRVQVDAGGCHGYQYKMELTSKVDPEDAKFGQVIVDPITLDMIDGSKVDYIEELIGSSFQVVDNPKAESSCGCKVSFNIKE
jgi:iron-sulfur cluster assembly 2